MCYIGIGSNGIQQQNRRHHTERSTNEWRWKVLLSRRVYSTEHCAVYSVIVGSDVMVFVSQHTEALRRQIGLIGWLGDFLSM